VVRAEFALVRTVIVAFCTQPRNSCLQHRGVGPDLANLMGVDRSLPRSTSRCFPQTPAGVAAQTCRTRDLQTSGAPSGSTPTIDVRRFGQLHNILTQAWSPLGHGQLITNKSVVEVAERIGATPAQVLLAWSLHNGIMPITKTLSTTRLQSNYQAIELELAESEIAVLNALADGYRTGPDPEIYGAQ
jgi:hypothetical protein